MTDDFLHVLSRAKLSRRGADIDDVIIDALLDYTRYAERTGQDAPNPFDDPYVGAALFDGDHNLLGAYRKEKPGERHSEPEAILTALAAIGSAEAAALKDEIDSQYQKKVWLEGGQKQARFEEAFAKAGNLLREHHHTEMLILYSSLEPCGLYEAQPSCANIIAAVRVSKVVYASDDINPKGFGRPVLDRAGIDVIGNCSVAQAIRMNNLFFAVADICNRTFSSYDGHRLFAGPPYAIFRRDVDMFGFIMPTGTRRLELTRKVPIDISYVGPETQRIAPITTQAEVSHLTQRDYDPELVFFYGGESFAEVSKILHYESRTRLALPGTFIFTRNPFLTADNARLKRVAETLNDRAFIRTNSFRKQDEFWEAVRLVVLSDFRSELRDHFAVVVKSNFLNQDNGGGTVGRIAVPPYSTRYVDSEEAVDFVRECMALGESHSGYVARIAVLSPPRARDKVETFLEALRPELSARGRLSRTSLQVRIVAVPGSEQQATHAAREFLAFRDRFRHLSRLDMQAPLNAAPGLDLTAFAHDVMAGLRDPKFFDPDYLDRLARSRTWTDRRNAGTIYARLTAASGDYAERTFLARLAEIADEGLQETNWAECCSRLNALRDASSRVPESFIAGADTVLQSLARALHRVISGPSLQPWIVDVAWRWLACWFDYVGASNDGSSPTTDYEVALGGLLVSDPFLLSEAVQYCYRADTDGARTRLHRLTPKPRDAGAVRGAAIRLARLSSAEHSSPELSPELLPRLKAWLRVVKRIGGLADFKHEYRRCQAALQHGVVELGQTLSKKEGESWHEPDTRTVAADALRSYVGRRAISRLNTDTTVSQRLLESSHLAEHIKSWRADYRVVIEDLLTFIPPNRVAWFLMQLAADTDISVRWAAVSIAFNSRVCTTACNVEYGASAEAVLREVRAKVVEHARAVSPHYWIEREVLWAFLSAHQRQPGDDIIDELRSAVPSAARLGLQAYLRGPLDVLHPELRDLAEKLRSRCKSVLLVLPPIEWPSGEDTSVARTGGSPPLGLGQIATCLSADGHYVEIIDAHRYVLSAPQVADHAAPFDYLGLSVVFSTFNSSLSFLTLLARRSADARPTVVLGGHGPTLNEGAFLASQAVFNYLVVGPGETAFLRLIRGDTPSEIEGLRDISRLSESKVYDRTPRTTINRTAQNFRDDWGRLPTLDRSVFHMPREFTTMPEAVYEPALTRNAQHVEAHVVTSRGCDWACSFCTEAIVNGGRETRRPVESVLAEVGYLMNLRNVDRVQFIDDNLFPPIGMRGLDVDGVKSRIEWSRTLLEELALLRSRTTVKMAWRGLMRLEDYLRYCEVLDDFPRMLNDAGCNLLAFGIEHGNEDARRLAKAGGDGSVSNTQIADIVARLHELGIFSKGYFMLGGQHDSPEGASETIDFAIASGLDLAYFAIFKDFRLMARSQTILGDAPPAFKLFDFDLGAFVLGHDDGDAWQAAFGERYTDLERDERKRVFAELTSRGFRFADLFKYNDYHLAAADSTVFSATNTGGPGDGYFQTLRRAYLSFYGRGDWVTTYEKLIEAGY